jgi:hypothetical protein
VSLAKGDSVIIIIIINCILFSFYRKMYVIVVARSKAWVFGQPLVGIAGSNLAGRKDVCLL